MKLGRDAKTNVVFVSNEKKSDWVLKTPEKITICRPELVYEFHTKTEKQFGIIDFSRFLQIKGATQATICIAELLESIDTENQKDVVKSYAGFVFHQATIEITKLVKSYLKRGEITGFGSTPLPPNELHSHVNSLRRVAEPDPMFSSFATVRPIISPCMMIS